MKLSFFMLRREINVHLEMSMRRLWPLWFFFVGCSLSSHGVDYSAIQINEILVANVSNNIDPRNTNFSAWVEFYNPSDTAIDLRSCYVSNDVANPKKSRLITRLRIQPKGFGLLWFDGTQTIGHSNLTLKNGYGMLGLYDPDGKRIDEVYYDPQWPDVSYGRKPDGSLTWGYFDKPTPEESNTTKLYPWKNVSAEPEFSYPGGFYDDRIFVQITSPSENSEIRYTTDGSIPTRDSKLFTTRIRLYSTTVVRARVFEEDKIPSKTVSHTYFINMEHTLPVISVALNPEFLWDDEIGIYVRGTNGVTGNCMETPVNWNRDWERPISFEYYEPGGQFGFKLDAGTKIFGGCSRQRNEKSLSIFIRAKYGTSKISYPIFLDKDISTFNNLVLRNSGNDNNLTMMRDGTMQALVKGQLDIDTQAYRPAIVYLNGEYWGIHNIREKLNEHYPETNYGIDPLSVDLLERNQTLVSGEKDRYVDLANYITRNDLANPAHYAYVKSRMDINEYINYQIAQIYFANTDWPGNNIKYWAERAPFGKWRWILFDTDFGFGLKFSYGHDTIKFALEPSNSSWPNPSWSTLMLRNLMKNEEFKHTFIQRFMSCFTYVFAEERVSEIINSIKSTIEPEMADHIALWRSPSSINAWHSNVNVMLSFGKFRQRFITRFLKMNFNLSSTVAVDLTVANKNTGSVYACNVYQTNSETQATFYSEIPVQLKAVPAPGYRFVRWEGQSENVYDTITMIPENGDTYTAVFEPGNPLVITEIHYHPTAYQGGNNGEFIELFNNSGSVIDLSGYSFKNAMRFTFPEKTVIQPGEYILVANNAGTFNNKPCQVFEWFDGKLSNNGEKIILTNPFNHIVDEVDYGIEYPWPVNSNGKGYSLSLLDPQKDNSLPESWQATLVSAGEKNQTSITEWLNY
jgi:hypothetical protein